MAATAARNAKRKDSDLVLYKIGAVKIYKGTLVSIQVADGYAYPARNGTATDIFIGVAHETVDNSAGSAGDKSLLVEKKGTYEFPKSTAVITDLGKPVYASDDQTLTLTSTNAQLVGYPVELIDSATLRIIIDAAVK
jgi:predicted RecA/RadA family phage recombinase